MFIVLNTAWETPPISFHLNATFKKRNVVGIQGSISSNIIVPAMVLHVVPAQFLHINWSLSLRLRFGVRQ